MSASNLLRLGAVATIVSGGLLLAAPFFFNLHLLPRFSGRYQPVLYVLFGVSLVAALLLVPVGMVGFHALQRHAYGRKGGAFFWLVVVGSMSVVLGGVVFLARNLSSNVFVLGVWHRLTVPHLSTTPLSYHRRYTLWSVLPAH